MIIIAELRIKIIPQLNSCKDRRDIYYKIDAENMVKDIRNNNFTPQKLTSILDLISEKISIIDPKYQPIKLINSDKWTKHYCDEVIIAFKSMYNNC